MIFRFVHYYIIFSKLYSFNVLVHHNPSTPCLRKNSQNCFWYNFVKFPPTSIIFGVKMAKTILLCKLTVHSFTTSPNLCRRTTVWNTDAPNCYITWRLFVSDGSPFASSIRQTVRRGLIILRYKMFYAENSWQQNSWLMSLKHV